MLNRGIIQLIKIHQKLCTQREQSSFLSTKESIQLNASYSSNTSEEMIPINSEEIQKKLMLKKHAVSLNILEEVPEKVLLMQLQSQIKLFVN